LENLITTPRRTTFLAIGDQFPGPKSETPEFTIRVKSFVITDDAVLRTCRWNTVSDEAASLQHDQRRLAVDWTHRDGNAKQPPSYNVPA